MTNLLALAFVLASDRSDVRTVSACLVGLVGRKGRTCKSGLRGAVGHQATQSYPVGVGTMLAEVRLAAPLVYASL